MDYREMFKEENYAVMERYDLSMERIHRMSEENSVKPPFDDYFKRTAGFIGQIEELSRKLMRDELADASLDELKALNHSLYEDILPENYEESYGNPAYAVEKLGDGMGQLLSFLYTQIRGGIIYAYESRLAGITALNETFIEVYNAFEEGMPETESIRQILYWFVSDYADQTVSHRIREGIDSSLTFAADIIMKEDLSDLRYLYRFGEYISETELEIAAYLNSLPEETIEKMADTYTEGYRKGFEVTNRDLSRKNSVGIRYELGFERMIRRAVENFRKLGLEPVFCRAAIESINVNPNRKLGYYGTPANKQYDYDHRYDSAIYMDKALKDRKAGIAKVAYEAYKKEAAGYAGPAVVETFGENPFEPVNKPEALKLSEKQQQLSIQYANEAAELLNQYVPGDETSFTIIAFPKPEIGESFEEIFAETIAINTLDYEVYKGYQQIIIDVLDEADYVTVTGKGDNETNLRIQLHKLENPDRQTNFENCVADVNIPLGEVFTSPVLAGTEGLLHVGQVYIGEIQFKNLKMRFENGMAVEFSCENFENPEEGKELIKQVIMKNHDSLPMGEFAIGTNTAAYAMAQRFDILNKLPILIVEKMGPHFAVGDTCYSWSEDCAVYNPDGKEIIARDNEVSLLRKEDVSRAYFSCHTDITIPYKELGDIYAVKADGEKTAVILNGRFALQGLEEINRYL